MGGLIHLYSEEGTGLGHSPALEMCMGMGFPMGTGIKHRIGNGGNGKPTHWEWEFPALPWEFIPKSFMLR